MLDISTLDVSTYLHINIDPGMFSGFIHDANFHYRSHTEPYSISLSISEDALVERRK